MFRLTALIIGTLLAGGFAVPGASAQDKTDLQLFLLIGQSNMAGRGVVEPQDKEIIPHILMLNKELAWVPAVDPLHFDKPAVAGVGLGRTFAKTLLRVNPAATIGLIPAAFGGTSLDEWKPGDKLYTDAIRRTKEALKSGKLRGILWHQGEADAGTEEHVNTYRTRFANLVQHLRSDLDAPDVPVVVGELGEFQKGKFTRQLNEQLALIPFLVPHSAFASSAGLTDKGDDTHFNSPSAREFGRRYALAFLALDPTWSAQAAARPSVYIVGDSTANNTENRGWGDHLAPLFDTARINVANRARAGRSSRTFQTEGLWDKVVADLKPGDFVLIQFGHNDGGPPDKDRARGSLPGLGDESKEFTMPDGHVETVRTFGWYMRKFIADSRAKGAHPVVLSLTVRNIWQDGKVERGSGKYSQWSREIAQSEHVPFVDVTNIVADRYEKLGEGAVKPLFSTDHTHTSPAGADINAGAVVSGLKDLRSPLAEYLMVP